MSKGPKVKELRSEPVPGVVELLEEYLKDAKAGNIRSVAFVGVRKGDVVITAWERGDSGNHLHQLISGSTLLQHRLCRSLFDD